jgi:hypothetical protein
MIRAARRAARRSRPRVRPTLALALVPAALALAVASAGPSSAAASCPGQPADAYSRAVLADHPLAYYRLGEAGGSTLCDSSSTAVNGTYASGVTHGVLGALPSDPAATAVSVSAPSAGIGTGGPGVTGHHSFTLEGWFQRAGPIQSQTLVDMGQAATGTIAGLATWSAPGASTASELAVDLYGTSVAWNTAGAGVDVFDKHWHFLVIAFDSSTDRFTAYVDGIGLGSRHSPSAIDLAGGPIRLGYWVDTVVNQHFVGAAQEIAVFDTALTAAQIRAQYAASGAPPKGGVTPVLARLARVGTISGSVSVELPGSQTFHPMLGITRIPFGSSIDASAGVVRVETATSVRAATQVGLFHSGQFRLTQARSGATLLTLDAPLACGAYGQRRTTAVRRRSRSLWGDAHGSFTTDGRFAAATVLGTKWETTDTCSGTRVTVEQGEVRVTDHVRHRTVIVTAPHSYLAGA